MKICVDSIGISHLMGTGLGSFTLEFLKNLLYMYPQPNYDLLYDNSCSKFNIKRNTNISIYNLNVNRLDNDYSNIESHIISNKVNIYHSPNNGFSIPKNKKCHYIITVHDLLPVVNPSYVDDKYLKKFNMVFPNAIKNSDKIIVVSDFLKEQLRNYFDVPDKKILVNYPGCSTIFAPKNKESCENILSSKYNINGDYILHVGSIHIRKNLEKLIKAFKYINLDYRDLKLVLVGNYQRKRRKYFHEIEYLIEDLKLSNSVIFTGLVDYYDMPYFYSNAKCVLNLSKYEGFPLSSLEAMACNTPVIWNNKLFFREVFGDAGLAIDANDNDKLVNSISNVLFNNNFKQDIVKKQKDVCLKYKWEKNILSTIKLYESFF